MRIYILSLVFACGLIGNIVGSSTQSLAALGNPGNCVLPLPGDSTVRLARADVRPPQLEPQLPPLDSEARDYLIRTIVFEAGGETEIGKVAVAHVILNRARLGRGGGTGQEEGT